MPASIKSMLSALAMASVTLLAGCSQVGNAGIDVEHVHAIDYVGDRVFMATHNGLVFGAPSAGAWYWNYVGHERFDYMGFASDGQTFYASGHPDDAVTFGGTMLGVRRSTDQGHLWEQRSLKGEGDLHALAVDPSGDLLAFWRGSIMRSPDGGLSWTNQASPSAHVVALAASPSALWAAAVDGLYSSPDVANWSKTTLPAAIVAVAAARDGQTILASQVDAKGGATWISRDAGLTWSRLANHALLEAPQGVLLAIDRRDPRHLFAADAGGTIISSADSGQSWQTLRDAT